MFTDHRAKRRTFLRAFANFLNNYLFRSQLPGSLVGWRDVTSAIPSGPVVKIAAEFVCVGQRAARRDAEVDPCPTIETQDSFRKPYDGRRSRRMSSCMALSPLSWPEVAYLIMRQRWTLAAFVRAANDAASRRTDRIHAASIARADTLSRSVERRPAPNSQHRQATTAFLAAARRRRRTRALTQRNSRMSNPRFCFMTARCNTHK